MATFNTKYDKRTVILSNCLLKRDVRNINLLQQTLI